ncbi:MAG: aminoacyl-tRNA hydrolase [Thermaerobacter sp.]|nr:aminoacyl-tRNA hydrolase [Thermaerobacter sp.]
MSTAQRPLRLLVGLGNPGDKYRHTRHNVGFMTVDRLALRLGLVFRAGPRALVAQSSGFWIMKPQTFMNLSGEAVAPFMRKRGIVPDQIVVVGDDLDLSLGQLRIRERGSSGGHNGMQSVIHALGTDEFCRLRIGISRPPADHAVIDWVLSRFSAGEGEVLEQVLHRAADALEHMVLQGCGSAMNRFNGPG